MYLLGRVRKIGVNGKLISSFSKVDKDKVLALGSSNKLIMNRAISCGFRSFEVITNASFAKTKSETSNGEC